MNKTAKELIKLGYKQPELRPHLRPVLDELTKTAGSPLITAITYGGNQVTYDAAEIQDMLANLDAYYNADNLPKWMNSAARRRAPGMPSWDNMREFLENVLNSRQHLVINVRDDEPRHNGVFLAKDYKDPNQGMDSKALAKELNQIVVAFERRLKMLTRNVRVGVVKMNATADVDAPGTPEASALVQIKADLPVKGSKRPVPFLLELDLTRGEDYNHRPEPLLGFRITDGKRIDINNEEVGIPGDIYDSTDVNSFLSGVVYKILKTL